MAVDTTILDQLIVGRVKPHIYAFATNTVPNHLKVGDTYRPVATRLREWREHFPDLTKECDEAATVSQDVYFRDFAVHRFLDVERGKARLSRDELADGVYFSKEFFRETAPADVQDAIADIRESYKGASDSYDYYDANRLPIEYHYARGPEWTLRPNQQEAVDRFAEAVRKGRTNLLMYAVMRFGKSFTSLCCAKTMGARTVLIVSAKADVKVEWKRTVETAGNFEGYVFLDSDQLDEDPNAIKAALDAGQTAAVFLTLQDLQGPHVKDKHAELFGSDLDLLIVDETHFGARAEEYGRILKDAGQPTDDSKALAKVEDDLVDTAEADEQLKVLTPRVRLHLSGTPYRILMSSEFSTDDIIAFVQFSDIVRDQEAWDAANLAQDEPADEWENPYFGFPQMVRFAFNPSRAARQKMEELAKSGVSLTLSALLEPRSIKRDSKTGSHKRFLHEAEVIDLLRVIDGSQQDDNLLGLLDYERIKEGMMCRHMVMVLPYRASCDAMEALIDAHRDQFKNLGCYQIVNISGVEGAKRYRSPEQVKKAIAEAEAQGAKTLTLTVNRMLTGSTVEQWDTMLHLKDTSSPQEYDQAIFRLQNQYVRTLYPGPDAASEDAGRPIRENLKPQTLLVDFDPQRLFRMQEQKSLIYNANTEENGNAKLRQRIEEEIRISPIITMNLGRIHRVEATSILEAVSEYSSQRSIADEAGDIPVDLGVLKNQAILRVIEAQSEIGSKAGLTIGPAEGDKDDLDVPDPDDDAGSRPGKGLGGGATSGEDEDETVKSLARKLQTYYQRILFFAMLTPSHVKSLSEIVGAMADGDNARIADHLSLDVETLGLLLSELNPFKLSSLDYKIQNISQLVRDDTLDPVERAMRALNKFSRISDSEVRTPSWLCRDMVAAIPGPELVAVITRGETLLDIASKSGEFALALCQRLVGELGVRPETIRDRILSVPTSSISYEFTRRFYEILGLDVGGIATDFTTYDLVGLSEGDAEELLRGDAQFEFGVVIGNPPYQADDGGYGTSAGPIYQRFVELAKNLGPRFVSMVTPSRWFSGGKGLDKFRDEMLKDHRMAMLVDFPKLWEVFPDAKIRGGVSYFVWDRNHDGPCRVETVLDGRPAGGTAERFLDEFDVLVRRNEAVSVLQKVRAKHEATLDGRVSSRKPFGLATNYSGSDSSAGMRSPVQLFANQRTAWIERSDIPVNADWVDDWKVLTTAVQGTSAAIETRFLSNPIVAGPGQACTETYLVAGRFGSQEEADRYANYLRTRFVRFLVSLRKPTQHATRDVFAFVPDLPMDRAWPETDLYQRYGLSADQIDFIEATVKPMNAPDPDGARAGRHRWWGPNRP